MHGFEEALDQADPGSNVSSPPGRPLPESATICTIPVHNPLKISAELRRFALE
jgi:hypothetical protein